MNRQAGRQAGRSRRTNKPSGQVGNYFDYYTTIAASYDIVANLLDGLKFDGAGDRRIKAWQRH